ncbi:MAG: hypothetical protein AAB731_05305 [Patescibacteria group bacterium]
MGCADRCPGPDVEHEKLCDELRKIVKSASNFSLAVFTAEDLRVLASVFLPKHGINPELFGVTMEDIRRVKARIVEWQKRQSAINKMLDEGMRRAGSTPVKIGPKNRRKKIKRK